MGFGFGFFDAVTHTVYNLKLKAEAEEFLNLQKPKVSE
jgi:hypothetical protein